MLLSDKGKRGGKRERAAGDDEEGTGSESGERRELMGDVVNNGKGVGAGI